MRAYSLHEALIYGSGDERPFLCPIHGDSRPSAYVNVVKQKWICFTCGAHGALTGEDALIEPDWETMKGWFTRRLAEGTIYPESWLARYTAGPVHQYWRDRVGEDAARHFKLGWDAESDRATYPLRSPSGEVLGVVRRALSDDGPKYLYPRGVDVGSLLFNYSPETRDVVFLVEGALDAIALWRVGVHAMAIYGARMSETQVGLIDRIDPQVVVTAFDNDDAGRHATREVTRALKRRMVVNMTWPRSWGKDVDELGEMRLKKVLSDLALPSSYCVGSSTWTPTRSESGCDSSTSSPRKLRITRTAS